ncbi:hypothetical protein [Sulfurimonas sp.]|uniref:hypothetical protein n=1 Tax=Sulfurimonas sp. TaxID=2022749 RepID=UPI0035635CB8
MFKVTNTKSGVKATLSGFKTDAIASKIEACKSGDCDCDCDPEIMAKIDNIEFYSTKDGSNIVVTGDIDAQTLEPMMKECLIHTP